MSLKNISKNKKGATMPNLDIVELNKRLDDFLDNYNWKDAGINREDISVEIIESKTPIFVIDERYRDLHFKNILHFGDDSLEYVERKIESIMQEISNITRGYDLYYSLGSAIKYFELKHGIKPNVVIISFSKYKMLRDYCSRITKINNSLLVNADNEDRFMDCILYPTPKLKDDFKIAYVMEE
jgi:hypothetical protein